MIYGYSNLRERLQRFLASVQDEIHERNSGDFVDTILSFIPFSKILDHHIYSIHCFYDLVIGDMYHSGDPDFLAHLRVRDDFLKVLEILQDERTLRIPEERDNLTVWVDFILDLVKRKLDYEKEYSIDYILDLEWFLDCYIYDRLNLNKAIQMLYPDLEYDRAYRRVLTGLRHIRFNELEVQEQLDNSLEIRDTTREGTLLRQVY